MLPYYGISSVNISATGARIVLSPSLRTGQVLILKVENQANEKLHAFLASREMKPDYIWLWFI